MADLIVVPVAGPVLEQCEIDNEAVEVAEVHKLFTFADCYQDCVSPSYVPARFCQIQP